MITPRITRTGTFTADGYKVDVCNDNDLSMYLVEQPDEAATMRALDGKTVTVTIEPVDATPEEAPHGSPLDYLAEIKRLAIEDESKTHWERCDMAEAADEFRRRVVSLANATSLAILAEKRRTP